MPLRYLCPSLEFDLRLVGSAFIHECTDVRCTVYAFARRARSLLAAVPDRSAGYLDGVQPLHVVRQPRYDLAPFGLVAPFGPKL